MIESLLDTVVLPGSWATFAQALRQRFPKVLRLRRNTLLQNLPISTAPIAWYSLGRRPLADRPSATRCLPFAAGDYYVQDAGSLLALAVAMADGGLLRGKLICDLCAAPGGKATALVEAIDCSGFVLTNEPIGSRIGALKMNLSRTGSDRWAISSLDPQRLAERVGGVFDLVLVDAPCSGQALLGGGRQTAAALSAKQIDHSAARQRRILNAARRLVRPGGKLVYSTCTFAEAENEAQVRWLANSYGATGESVESLRDYQSAPDCYRLWPHLHDCAGSFAASLRMDDAVVQNRALKKFDRCDHTTDFLRGWYTVPGGGYRMSSSESNIWAWPLDAPQWVEEIAVAGPELAHRVGKTWRPAHAGALRHDRQLRALQSVELGDAEAQQFMRGEAVPCRAAGWNVVRWRGRPLGWMKADGSVGKNHLPKAARMPA